MGSILGGALLLVCLVLIFSGWQERKGNDALILRCGGTLQRDQVGYASWDGGKLVAVTCDDGRRLHR